MRATDAWPTPIEIESLNQHNIEAAVKRELDKRLGIEPPKILTKKDLES